MKAAVFRSQGSPLEIEDFPCPQAGRGEVLIRIKACGVCGSDIHALDSDWLQPGVVMGHEFAGVIAGLGEGVSTWRVGQRVAPLSQISCGECQQCREKNFSDCLDIQYLDYNLQCNGGYSEYVVVGQNDILPLPDSVSFAEAASMEPLAVALGAVKHAGITASDNLLIVGAGPIGLCIAQWARFLGTNHIVVSELNPTRRALAGQFGATVTLDAGIEADIMLAAERETGIRPNVIVEAVGIPGMIQRCIEMAEKKSKLLIVGVCQAEDVIQPMDAILKSLSIYFPFGYSVKDYGFILQQIEQGKIAAQPLISHRIGLDELPQMFTAMRTPSDQIKVIVEP